MKKQLTGAVSVDLWPRSVQITENTFIGPRQVFLMRHDIEAVVATLTQWLVEHPREGYRD